MKKILILAALLFASCSHRGSTSNPDTIVSIQVIDRNGFTETMSTDERLSQYQKVDFLEPQPYQKVQRVFSRSAEGKTRSAITSYHSNGQIFQYLDVVDGRAHGVYREWHPNGAKKLEVTVIEGVPDITEVAQASWLFDGDSFVWDEEGHLVAEIIYEKGLLEKISRYYHSNGQLKKEVPFQHGQMHGIVTLYDDRGTLLEKVNYKNGIEDALCVGFWNEDTLRYQEEYENGLIKDARYYDIDGKLISEIKAGKGYQSLFEKGTLLQSVEFKNGKPEGIIQIFLPDGTIHSSFQIKDGKKNGEERIYYSESKQPKLSLNWRDDVLQGMAKTWYENGILESQREMHHNKKQGLCFAWFKDGSLMLMEEYENDLLMKASYFKRDDTNPVSKIEAGKGTATLYDADGYLLHKITYEKGKPILED